MSPKVSISLLGAQSDQRLATLAGAGHERAFEALVKRYRRPLLRYCNRMQLSDARAEDVLQQAFLQAWLALARGSEVREVRPWLYRVVHNAAVNTMRGSSQPHSELTEATQQRAALAGESNLQRSIAVRDALTDVAALPQMQQRAIFLTAVDGQSHDEVAGVLGISEGALRGLLYRARATLRSAAAALTPPPLLQLAAGGSGAAGPSTERLVELSGGGGAAAGMAGLLLKGAVVAVTAGAVATGAAVVKVQHAPAAQRRSATAADSRVGVSQTLVTDLGERALTVARPRRQNRLQPQRTRHGSATPRNDRHGRDGTSGGGHRDRGGSSGDGGSSDAAVPHARSEGKLGAAGGRGSDTSGGSSGDRQGSAGGSGGKLESASTDGGGSSSGSPSGSGRESADGEPAATSPAGTQTTQTSADSAAGPPAATQAADASPGSSGGGEASASAGSDSTKQTSGKHTDG